MRVNGYQCDGQCGEQAVTRSHDSRPDGWVNVYTDDGSLHFCGWTCLATYVDQRRLPATSASRLSTAPERKPNE